MSAYPTPDLASVLATLAQQNPTSLQSAPIVPAPRPSQALSAKPEILQDRPSSVRSDNITQWPAALRCVTKIAAANVSFAEHIKHMIEEQRRHEKQWYMSRQALKHDQARRVDDAQKLSSILLAVGGTVAGSDNGDATTDDKAAELREFDVKVHRAQSQMHAAMSTSLHRLGVPFFDINPSVLDDSQWHNARAAAPGEAEVHTKKLSIDELQELQRRMIGHLEDLYKD